jgi:hypothetical protein
MPPRLAVKEDVGDRQGWAISGYGSLTWLAVCRAKVVPRKQVLYRRTPTRLTPPFKLPPAL